MLEQSWHDLYKSPQHINLIPICRYKVVTHISEEILLFTSIHPIQTKTILRGISLSVIATYVIPLLFNTEKSYFLNMKTNQQFSLIVVEVVLGLRRKLGKKALCDLGKVSCRLLIGGSKSLFTKNNIPSLSLIHALTNFRLIVA